MENKMKTEISLHAAAGWSRLPSDLLISILLHFLPLNDAIRFGAVCKEWRSAFSDAREKLRRRPWLMIPKRLIQKRKRTNTFRFRFRFRFLSLPLHDDRRVYEIDNGGVYKTRLTKDAFFMCSYQGWLIIGHHQKIQAPPKIYMVDVHTGDLYNLPPLSDEILNASITKAVVVPSSSGSYAVACTITSTSQKGGLMVGQAGGDHWTVLEKPPHMIRLNLEDLNYHEGLLYSICYNGNVLIWDLSQMSTSNSPKVLSDPSNSPKVLSGPVGKIEVYPRKFYIVPASPFGLLFIARYPYKFEVFALDSKTEEWMQLRCMGKCSLFLGRNQSMCLSKSDLPDMKENGIYLTESVPKQPQNIPKQDTTNWYLTGFYNLQDESFENHRQAAKPWAAWVIPNLN